MVALQKEAGAAGDPGHGAVRGRAGGAHPAGEHHHQPPEVAHGLQALHRCVAFSAIIFLLPLHTKLGRKASSASSCRAVRYTTGRRACWPPIEERTGMFGQNCVKM